LDNDETIEAKFYSLYNVILNHWFSRIDGYGICPQWKIPGSNKSVDFTITFLIGNHEHPLLLVEVKPPSHFQMHRRCRATIGQVNERLDDIGPNNQHAERLYAISMIGKRWRACYAFRGNSSHGGRSVRGIAERSSLRSAKPECWNADITSNASWAALQSIVETIKGYVA